MRKIIVLRKLNLLFREKYNEGKHKLKVFLRKISFLRKDIDIFSLTLEHISYKKCAYNHMIIIFVNFVFVKNNSYRLLQG